MSVQRRLWVCFLILPGAYSSDGAHRGPEFSMGARREGGSRAQSPGPGAYSPHGGNKSPEFSMGARREGAERSRSPGPGAYHLKDPSTPDFTMMPRRDTDHGNKNPGPGDWVSSESCLDVGGVHKKMGRFAASEHNMNAHIVPIAVRGHVDWVWEVVLGLRDARAWCFFLWKRFYEWFISPTRQPLSVAYHFTIMCVAEKQTFHHAALFAASAFFVLCVLVVDLYFMGENVLATRAHLSFTFCP